MSGRKIEVRTDLQSGLYDLIFENGSINGACSRVKTGEGKYLTTADFAKHEVTQDTTETENGSCSRTLFTHTNENGMALVQEFCIYESFVTVGVRVSGSEAVTTNYMAPVYVCGAQPALALAAEKIHMLNAPFDNDKWAKFVDFPVKYSGMSYEFTVFHPAKKKDGLVMGSVDHDNWKTGFTAACAEDGSVTELAAICGVATEDTRDIDGVQHGAISGTSVSSARIFIGYFDNYQEGLKEYGKANAAIRPMLPWDGPVIFGWNSWAAHMGKVSFQSYKNASDFMKSIQDTYKGSDGKQFINYDAAWGKFTNRMKDSVAYAKANNQEPGSYFSPFIVHDREFETEVPGTDGNYLFEDLLLRDENGKVLSQVDGLYSLDPTHPGTLAYMEYVTGKMIAWGFESIKTDFVAHAAREGVHYDRSITTGVQAFNFGMAHFAKCLSKERAGYPIFISLSIAPIMPHGYGHARRISCDAFGTLDQSAYVNNCITYLWWMNDSLYRFNDPDHIVTYKTYDKHSTLFEEGKTRYHVGVICGSLMLCSDDYSIPEAKERARAVLTNEEVNAVARKGESFYPVSLPVGEYAADIFARKDDDAIVVAAFNYCLSDEAEKVIPLSDLGLDPSKETKFKDLWTKEWAAAEDGALHVKLKAAQSTILKVYQ